MMIERVFINLSRVVLSATLFLNFYNGFLSLHPQIPKISSWGTLWQGLFLTVLIAWTILEALNYYLAKRGEELPSYFWILTALATSWDSLSNFFLLYEISGYDKIMHLFGGLVFGFLSLKLISMLDRHFKLNMRHWVIYYLTVSTVNFGAVLYEIGEWIGDKFYSANNIIGLFDTSEDLLFNIIGGLAVIAVDFLLIKLRGAK